MSIMTAREAIEALKQCDPDETLLITYWGDTDFTEHKNRGKAFDLAEQQLETCIGHVNEWVDSQIDEDEDYELCDECGAPHEDDVKVRS
jgi:hypothetical protein